MLIDHWPLLGLRVITPRLELRLPAGEELSDLADLAAEGIHHPGSRPFLVSWPGLPPKERARALVAAHGQVTTTRRLRLTRDRWQATDRPPVTITGLTQCLPLFGLPGDGQGSGKVG